VQGEYKKDYYKEYTKYLLLRVLQVLQEVFDPVPDLHRSKRSSAWGPPDSMGPQIYKKNAAE